MESDKQIRKERREKGGVRGQREMNSVMPK